MAKSTSPVVVSATVSIDPGSVATLVGAYQTVTVKGLRKGYPVVAWTEDASMETTIVLSEFHCSAADTLKFKVNNVSATDPVDASARTWHVVQR